MLVQGNIQLFKLFIIYNVYEDTTQVSRIDFLPHGSLHDLNCSCHVRFLNLTMALVALKM